jgi:4-nitrophenyl phosphatase
MFCATGKQIFFVTNNSTKSRQNYKKKLDALGIPATVNEIFGSAYSSAVYISLILNLPKDKKVFVMGEGGIEAELESCGVKYIGGSDPTLRRAMQPEDYTNIANGNMLDPDVGLVLCGLDHEINYLKLSLGYAYLRKLLGAGTPASQCWLATNLDSTLPSAGSFFPGASTTTVAPITNMLYSNPTWKSDGLKPVSLGKPSQAMLDAIEGKVKFEKARTCMVGDRCDTDIQFGIDGGLGGTLGVLSGVSTEEEMTSGPSRPKYLLKTLGDLAKGKDK